MRYLKNRNVVGLFMFAFVLTLSASVLAVDIDACDYAISTPGIYNITQDITAINFNCIDITSSDVVLDCGGFILDGGGAVGSMGIYALDVENIIIKNCEINSFESYGIFLENVGNSVFENLVLNGNQNDGVSDQGGLNLFNSNNNNFSDVLVMNDGWIGIFLWSSNFNIFDNTSILSSYFDGLEIYDSNNNIFKNSKIVDSQDGVGIFVEASQDNLFYNNFFDNFVNADVFYAEFDNFWNSSIGNYWGSCDDDGDGICNEPYDVSDGDMSAFDYLPLANEDRSTFIREIEFNLSEWGSETTDFSEFNDEELKSLEEVIFVNDFGRILFWGNIGILRDLILNGNITILNGRIFLDSSVLPEFNEPAELRFYGLTFDEPRIWRDGVICEDCVSDYINGTLIFNVTGFSEYYVDEGYTAPVVEEKSTSSSGGSSGGSGPTMCADGYHFENRRCVADEIIVLENVSEKDEETILKNEAENDEGFESVITGNVVGLTGLKDWKVVLGIIVLVLVLVYFVRKKYINGNKVIKK